MTDLDKLNKMLKTIEEENSKIIRNWCDDYGQEYDEIDEFEIISEINEWETLRDLDYNARLSCVVENTRTALEENSNKSLKDMHRVNKAFERVIFESTRNREKLEKQMEQIKNLILQYDQIICLCGKYKSDNNK